MLTHAIASPTRRQRRCVRRSVQRAAPGGKARQKGNKIIELPEHLPKVEYTTEGDSLHMDLCMPAAQELNLNPSLLTGFLEEKIRPHLPSTPTSCAKSF